MMLHQQQVDAVNVGAEGSKFVLQLSSRLPDSKLERLGAVNGDAKGSAGLIYQLHLLWSLLLCIEM